MHSHLFMCPTMAPPCYNELPWKTMWVGEHLDTVEHKNVIDGCEGWTLYPNNNMVTRPPVDVVENQRPPMQKPPPMKCLFQPSLAKQLEGLANQATSPYYLSHNG